MKATKVATRHIIIWRSQGRCCICGRYVERILAAGYGDGRLWCRRCADQATERQAA